MARPQFGTSATQAACLFEALGPDKAKEYYRGLKSNGMRKRQFAYDVANAPVDS